MTFYLKLARPLAASPFLLLAGTQIHAHEAWLLTPDEILALASAPIPDLFQSQLWLGLSALAGLIITLVALRLEPTIERMEARVLIRSADILRDPALLALRLCLAAMLILAATGGLPRHGTAIWTTPTFLVPDMQISAHPFATALISAQIALGVALSIGAFTRIMALVLIFFSCVGPVLFGSAFLSYSLHFAAPGVLLLAFGSGRFALDTRIEVAAVKQAVLPHAAVLYRVVQIMVGVGFVYLGVAYKLLQPTLLIAILEHGGMPSFGLPMAVIALIMTGVEILCGALLVAGRLIRPVSLAILGAITFLAVILGETPLFHANLYGTLVVFLLIGRAAPLTWPNSPVLKGRAA